MIQEDVSLKHEFVDSEMAALAKTQAQAIERLGVQKKELEFIKKDYAGRISQAESEMAAISARINVGWEMRNVRCLLIKERPEGFCLTVRLDNGHIARRRILEPHERQISLTTSPPAPLAFSVLLPVDDKTWDVDFFEAALYDDEVAAMKDIPGLEFKPIQHKRALIEDGKGKKK